MNKNSLYKLSYGMYVICTKSGDKKNGQIANTLFQITSDPVTVAVSINKSNLTHEYIQKDGVFTVSVISESAPLSFIGNFGFKSGRDTDKFKDVKYKKGLTEAPVVLDYSVAYIEFKVINSLSAGSHTVFVGEMVDSEVLSEENVMTYAYYHSVKNGKSPKNAPTYISAEKNEDKKKEEKMKKYKCEVCGYIYDPDAGDPDSGIAPGTPFDAIPDSWVCPVCGAGKSDFIEES